MNSRTTIAIAAIFLAALGCGKGKDSSKSGETAKSGSGDTAMSGSGSGDTAKPAKTGVDLEVTHWWTSGGEAAAVAELAKAFDATGNHWVDGAIAGSGDVARPIMISRITGGDPMGATQFNHGRQAEELVQAGLMRDLTDLATKEHWKDIIRPASLLDSCTLERQDLLRAGQHPFAAVAVDLQQGVQGCRRADPDQLERVRRGRSGAGEGGDDPARAVAGSPGRRRRRSRSCSWPSPARRRTGRSSGTRTKCSPPDRRSPRCSRRPSRRARCRRSRPSRSGTRRPTWSSRATPAARSWATGRRASSRSPARPRARTTPACRAWACTTSSRPAATRSTSRKLKDEAKSKAQETLASVILSKETQVAFNLKKGSLPVRGDVDLNAANDCMKKGLAILAKGPSAIIQAPDQLMTARLEHPDQRSVRRVLRQAGDDGQGRAEALRGARGKRQVSRGLTA